MPIHGIDHFTVLTDDVGRTVDFYCGLLGLVAGYRPDLGFPGAWLYLGEQAVLHVVGGRGRESLAAGVIDHVALSATGLTDMLARLASGGIAYSCRRQSGSGTWQVFFHDPNGARIELDFAADETGPQ